MKKISTLLLTLLVCANCFGQWSTRYDVNNLICATPLHEGAINQWDPEMISDGDGGAIIAWIDQRDETLHIYAQRIDKNGIIKWQKNGVPICTATVGDHQSVSGLQLAVDGDGGAIITWTDERDYSGPWVHIPTGDIYAQRINAIGEVQWKKDGIVISDADNGQFMPVIVSDNQGGAFIAWYDQRNVDGSVYAQHVNSSGTTFWPANGNVVTSSSKFHMLHQLIADESGGFIVTWSQRGIDIHQNFVFAQRINVTGTPVWPSGGVQVVSPTYYAVQPKFISDGLGGIFLTWYHTMNQSSVTRVFAQHLLGNGTLAKPNATIICNAPVGHRDPELVSDDNGGAIITWQDGRFGDGASNYSIFAQRINAAGDALWAVNGVNVSLQKGNIGLPKIVRDGQGGAIILYNYDTYGTGVRMDRISSSGKRLWNPIPFATNRRNGHSMRIISNYDGGAIASWLDDREYAPGIYASRILENGTLPVTLVSFKGETQNGHSKLTWETSSETNNKGFEIERSIDGRNFKRIGYVEGNGTTSNENKSYRFIDSEPLHGKNYYRLKQLDWDGKFDHSSIIFVQHPIQETSKLYPNPVTNILLVNTLDFKGQILIIDLMGRVVDKVNATTNETSLNVSNLSPGLYLCRFGNTTQQFVKTK
ncbi:T9SS type A sorting domain-containing protein [Dyadobacter chenwenxiniae]|uniref:T9SS type A sorting domain-containing protein n=1 Tax=Dyadobacter chenwenxiniae TaxID=2906456 RepID=A0A9X1TET0_9BACT|nr:T9SS type A sorting domain-containing protein [Dyadobacter chenwenxiniae]MCF0061840.1 T9SS type A sorting domain-containing protein [Dyadobacter chenwenxiniae]UON81655.1 T9SS type A sorting domain-containing protein [Dyadobacter chenwenxiniae]